MRLKFTDIRIPISALVILGLAYWFGGRIPWIITQLLWTCMVIDLAGLLLTHRGISAQLQLITMRIYARKRQRFQLQLHNHHALPVSGVLLPNGHHIHQPLEVNLGPKKTWTYASALMFQERGPQTTAPLRLNLHSPLGLWRTEQIVLYPQNYLVYPALVLKSNAHIKRPPSVALSIPGVSPAGGERDFFDTRPYIPGDPPQRIHWKQSARQGQLFVRQEPGQQPGTLSIVIDCMPLDMPDKAAVSRFETVISLAAGLSDLALRKGYALSLATWGAYYKPLFAAKNTATPYDAAMTWLSELPSYNMIQSIKEHDTRDLLHSLPPTATQVILVTSRRPQDLLVVRLLRHLSGKMDVKVHSTAERMEVAR